MQSLKSEHTDLHWVDSCSIVDHSLHHCLPGAQDKVHRGSTVCDDRSTGESQLLCLKQTELRWEGGQWLEHSASQLSSSNMIQTNSENGITNEIWALSKPSVDYMIYFVDFFQMKINVINFCFVLRMETFL